MWWKWNKCIKFYKIMLFSVIWMHVVAKDREDHIAEVSFSYPLSQKQVSSHYYWKACQTSFKLNDKYYAWRESKTSFWQKSLIKGIPSGKAITVMCMLVECFVFQLDESTDVLRTYQHFIEMCFCLVTEKFAPAEELFVVTVILFCCFCCWWWWW